MVPRARRVRRRESRGPRAPERARGPQCARARAPILPPHRSLLPGRRPCCCDPSRRVPFPGREEARARRARGAGSGQRAAAQAGPIRARPPPSEPHKDDPCRRQAASFHRRVVSLGGTCARTSVCAQVKTRIGTSPGTRAPRAALLPTSFQEDAAGRRPGVFFLGPRQKVVPMDAGV